MNQIVNIANKLFASQVVKNAFFLFLVQAATLLVPLLTLPWILRALGPAAFGGFAFYQSVAQYGVIFVEFGFYLTATRHIAAMGDDPEGRSAYFWTVQTAKAMLAGLLVIIATLAWTFLSRDHRDAPLFFASLAIVIGTILTPMWLFAGLQRMGLISFSMIVARLAMIAPTLLLVHTPEDAWLAAAINSGGNILAGLIALALIVHHGLIPHRYRPTWVDIRTACQAAWHLFLSNSATSLYAAANPLLLALVSNSVQVGLFSAADRIRLLSLGPITPLSNAFYPALSRAIATDRADGLRMAGRLFAVLAGIMLLVSVLLFLSAPLLVRIIMGAGFENAVPVLRIMAAVPVLVGLNTCMGTLTMLPLGLSKTYSRILLGCGLLNLGVIAILGHRYGATGAAIALAATELTVVIAMAAALAHHGIGPALPLRRSRVLDDDGLHP